MFKRNSFSLLFETERIKFINETGIRPTHCIINPYILRRLIDENICYSENIIIKEIRDQYIDNTVILRGVHMKKGLSKDDFIFYESFEND